MFFGWLSWLEKRGTKPGRPWLGRGGSVSVVMTWLSRGSRTNGGSAAAWTLAEAKAQAARVDSPKRLIRDFFIGFSPLRFDGLSIARLICIVNEKIEENNKIENLIYVYE